MMKSCNHTKNGQKGQAIVLFALLLPVVAVFMTGILDYMVTNLLLMQAVAAADLAAHAGVQEIRVQPDGALDGLAEGQSVAAAYFQLQAPPGVYFAAAACGRDQGKPGCRVWARILSAGYLIPQRQIQVSATAYLAQGVTRDGQ